MVTVKCQHSRIEFEAKSRITKQHPLIAELKNQAAKDGDYHQAKLALNEATETGDYKTVEEYLALVQDIMHGKVSKKRQAEKIRLEAKEKAKKAQLEAKRKRQETNTHLYQHGYRWVKEPKYVDSFYEGDNEDFFWALYSPDGRPVTVAQALDEIERGVATVEIELAEIVENDGELPYDVVLSGKLAEAEAKRKQKESLVQETMQEQWQEAKDVVKNEMIEVESFNYDSFEVSFKQDNKIIYRSVVNGVDCAVIYNYRSYGNDYNIIEQFYCTDPAQAGLEPVERERMEKKWMKFFGE